MRHINLAPLVSTLFLCFFALAFSSCSHADVPNGSGTQIDEKITANQQDISLPDSPNYENNELLVKFKPEVTKEEIKAITEGLNLEIVSEVSLPNCYLLKIRGNETIEEMVEILRNIKEVEYAEPNYIRQKTP